MTGTFTVQQIASFWGYYLFHAFWPASLTAISVISFVKIGKSLPSHVRYGALLVALLKFTVPFLPPLAVGVFNAMQSNSAELHTLNSLSDLVSQSARGAWLILLLAIYVLGLLVAASNLYRQQRQLNTLRRDGNEVRSGELYQAFSELARALKFERPTLLITSTTATVPFAYGLKTGIVVLPAILLERLSPAELRPVLAHELAHLRYRDQWINWWQALLGVAWWFNPFYHLLSKVMREVREECRDDAVLAAGLASDHSYSSSILAVAALAQPQSQPRIALHSLGHHPHPLAARLVRIANPNIARRERLTAPQLCLLVLGALFVLPGLTLKSASFVGDESKGATGVNSAFEFDHASGQDARQTHQQRHRATHKQH